MRLSREKLLEYLILYGLTPTLFLVKSYQVVTFLIVALFCYDIIRRKDWSVFNDTIFKIFSFWCLYLLISAFWAVEPRFAVSGAFELFVWCLLYLAIRSTITTKEQIEKFFMFQAYMVLFVTFNSVMQAVVGINMFGVHIDSSRVTDLVTERRTIGHILPIYLGLFGAMLAIPSKNVKQYLLFACALIGLLVTLPLTGTRGPLIILAIFLPVIAWLSPYRKIAFTSLGGLLVVVAMIVLNNPVLQQRVMSLKNPFEDQKHARISIWLTAFEQFKDNPIKGVGFHNFRYREFEYYDASFESYEIVPEKGMIVTHPHSPWMDILSEQGLIGIAFAISFLFVVARTVYSMGSLVMIGSMGVWYAFSLLNSTFTLSSGRWSFFMILAIAFFGVIVNYVKVPSRKEEP
ncbi:MAG: O-antigen ligase family protein [Sulfurospirillum sp.]